MKKLILAAAAATALLATAASAAPLGIQDLGARAGIDTEQVRMVCDQYGRCYRSRGPRYVQRGYGYGNGYRDNYRRSYGYDRGYNEGPSIGLSFGGGNRW